METPIKVHVPECDKPKYRTRKNEIATNVYLGELLRIQYWLNHCLLELHSDPTWRADTGFKNGYLGKIEAMMEAKLPGCELKVSPHIESRIKKAKYFALTELLALSGFVWNEEKMMLACEKSVYDETTKVCIYMPLLI